MTITNQMNFIDDNDAEMIFFYRSGLPRGSYQYQSYEIRYTVYHIRCKTYYMISLLPYTLIYYNTKFMFIMWIIGPNETQNHMRITISTTY